MKRKAPESRPDQTEMLAIKTRLEALHDKLGEGSTAWEFVLRALCALEGAIHHIGSAETYQDQERNKP